jgi:hypothetical protein
MVSKKEWFRKKNCFEKIIASKKELLLQRVFTFWKMHRRKNKSLTVNHFVAEGFLGYIIFFGLCQALKS